MPGAAPSRACRSARSRTYNTQGEQATSGLLDAASLCALPPEAALERLQGPPGIGPFGAELILLRGAGEPDRLPTHAPRLARAGALAFLW